VSKPPADVEPSELWLKLCEPRPSEVIDFPRRDAYGNFIGKIRIQVLTMEDHNKARLLATGALKKHVKEFGMDQLNRDDMDNEAVREVLGDLIAHELLALACFHEKSFNEDEENPMYARFFKSPEDIRKKLTADETLVLFNAYRLTQHKWGPFERGMADDTDVEAWIKRLEEGGSVFPLLALPLPQLAELTFSMSARICTLCDILASQFESLPPTLKSSLTDCFTDIGWFGKRHAESTENFSASSRDFTIATALDMSEKTKTEHESGM
jgi:hypothetical protein